MMRSLWWYPWRALRELGWWLMRLFRLVGRHPFRTLVLGLVVGWFAWGRDDWRPMILVTIVLLGFGLWARLAPAPFDRWVSMPLFRYRKKRFVRRSWGRVLTGSGLVQREYAEQEKGRVTVVPSLRRPVAPGSVDRRSGDLVRPDGRGLSGCCREDPDRFQRTPAVGGSERE